jgi:hypothetical protein
MKRGTQVRHHFVFYSVHTSVYFIFDSAHVQNRARGDWRGRGHAHWGALGVHFIWRAGTA